MREEKEKIYRLTSLITSPINNNTKNLYTTVQKEKKKKKENSSFFLLRVSFLTFFRRTAMIQRHRSNTIPTVLWF